jgi:hypothetical protein
MESFEDTMRRGGGQAVKEACRFFMKDDRVFRTLHKITEKLAELEIPYAVSGGMALVAHGHNRTTIDVDILVTSEGLAKVHHSLEGLGYVAPFSGSKNLRDVETNVKIEFLVAGQFPGDGKPKPVAFPDPVEVSVDMGGIRYLGLPALIELKLASGMTNPGRLKDLADVQELIYILRLPAEFAEQLNPYVRQRYVELWSAVQANRGEE